MNREKYIKYFKRNLTVMPTAFTAYDSSHVSLVYFCIAGLKLLGGLTEIIKTDRDREEWIDWIYLHLVPSGDGFRGSMSHNLGDSGRSAHINDPANLAATFFCLSMLAILQDESMTEMIDRKKVLKYVKSCQRPSGQFGGIYNPSIGPVGDNDPRYTYVAAAIRRILQGDKLSYENRKDIDFDIDGAVEYIKSTKSYDGGLGDREGSESHAGLVFCGLGALSLMNTLDSEYWEDTKIWLSKRQLSMFTIENSACWHDWEVGGFNGRVNKPVDTCYVYWASSSLDILDSVSFIDRIAAKKFLFENCLDSVMGGMVKAKGGHADPLHSYLGLAALALLCPELGLGKFDSSLTLPQSTVDFIDLLVWKD